MPIKKYSTKIYRYVRFRKGHGIHSPFAFELINKVIEEKKRYYIFDEIKKLKSDFGLKSVKKKKYGPFLFRLADFLKPKHIVQIGFSEEIEILYLLGALNKGKLTLLEKDVPSVLLAEKISENFKVFELKTDINASSLKILWNEPELPDFLFFNISDNIELTESLLKESFSLLGEQKNTIFVIDSIRKDTKMKTLWKSLTLHPQVSMSMDLYSLGLLFFDKGLYKKNYKIHF